MRLAILNWRDLAHPDSGGAEVFVNEVARVWIQDGHDVTLISSTTPLLPDHEEREGVNVQRVGTLKSGSHHVLAPRLVRTGYDGVLESINTFPYFLPWRLRKGPEYVSLVHQMAVDVWDAHLPRPLASLAKRVEPHLYWPYRARAIAAVSASTERDLRQAGVKDVSVIPQGGLGYQEALPGKEEFPTFLFVGRLSPNKRPDHALEAFRMIKHRIPQARLWIVGTGEMKERLLLGMPNDVEMFGRLERGQLIERMGRAHILLITSVREGWGLVVTEANAMGTPAIGYDVPGLTDSIVHGETGLVVEPEPKSLADASVALIEDQPRYRALASAALEWGSNCTWSKPARTLLQLLKS